MIDVKTMKSGLQWNKTLIPEFLLVHLDPEQTANANKAQSIRCKHNAMSKNIFYYVVG